MVEDNPGDIRLVEEALEDTHVKYRLHAVHDGEKALSYLRQSKETQDVTKPDLILLDLNLPKKNGHQVLEEIKQDEKLCNIPVIILSSSRSKDDIVQADKRGAHAYIPKPENFDDYTDLVQEIEKIWVKLPATPSV